MALLLGLVRVGSNILTAVPGLLVLGLGVGAMLTSSVDVVQSAFSDADQGQISGVSRSVSHLGSSFGTALAGSVLVAAASIGNESFAAALATILGFAVLGLVLALLIPGQGEPAAGQERALVEHR